MVNAVSLRVTKLYKQSLSHVIVRTELIFLVKIVNVNQGLVYKKLGYGVCNTVR